MNVNSKKMKILSITIIVCLIFLNMSSDYLNAGTYELLQSNQNPNAISPNGIEIYDDIDLAAASSSGTGDQSTPYVLEDFHIDTSDVRGVYITDTTKHFVLENCTITAIYGIYLDNVSYGTYHLRNNSVIDCSAYGVAVFYSGGGMIEDNILVNNGNGIDINYCPDTIITDNYCQNRNAGIFVRHSEGTVVNQNQMYGDGLEITDDTKSDYLSLECSDNYVNDKLILYGENLTSYVEADYGQVILVNCSNFLMRNLIITNVDIAVILYYCYSVGVYDAYISNTDNCVVQFNCEWCWVVDSELTYSSNGISAEDSASILCEGNYIGYNTDGIYLTFVNSSDIRHNDFEYNNQGAVVLDTCNGVHVHHNNFYFNGNASGYQAEDNNGINNWWYELATTEGNYWSDLGGATNYTIAGTPTYYDLYPLASPYIPIPEFSQTSSLIWILATLLVSSFIIVPILKKKRK